MTIQTVIYTGEDIHINGITLNRIDDSGCKWILNDLEGWWGLPEASIPDDTRASSDDGSFYVAGRFMPRVITMTGAIIPGSNGSSQVVELRNTLNRAITLVRQTGVLQVDEDPPKQARVQIVGRPLTRFTKNNVLEFNIQLRAADPRKYSATELIFSTTLPTTASTGRVYPKVFDYTYGVAGSAGLIYASNDGSYTTYGTLRIVGPIINPVITHIQTGNTLTFNITLGVGDYLDIDLRNKTVILNSSESRRITLTQASRWFDLAPGNNIIQFTGVQHIPSSETVPNAMVYLSYRSAWIE